MASSTKRIIALIRHGEYHQPAGVPSAHLPYGLTERGRVQASAAALALCDYARSEGLALDRTIDCSRMRRAWETAHLIDLGLTRSTGSSFTLRECDDLAERSLGCAANLSIDAIDAILLDDPRFEAPPPGWKRKSQYRLPLQGAESLDEAGTRVARHIVEQGRLTSEEDTLKIVVGHGGAFRHAAHQLGLLARADLPRLTMRHAAPVYLEYRVRPDEPDDVIHVGGEWPARDASAGSD